ncbi:MAG: hypothetical protein U0798_04015 [Gemmataceae bacterium]
MNTNTFDDPLNDPAHSKTLARLALDRECPVPPPGLATRTIARLAELMVSERGQMQTPATPAKRTRFVHTSDDTPIFVGRRRADLIVAASIGLLVVGLSITGVQKLRAEAAIRQCQYTLHDIHKSLATYADVHQGRYPTVGVSTGPHAGDFATELAQSGYMPANLIPVCPATSDSSVQKVGYAYTLGFRTPSGTLVGFRRPDTVHGDQDGIPMLADFPSAKVAPTSTGPISPHDHGQNVLFAGGYVRYTTSSEVGLGRDDIYRNDAGLVGAGLSLNDVCLGRPLDTP